MNQPEKMSKLTMRLSAKNLNLQKGSDLQGVLFEHTDREYADLMHQQGLHPYSQSLYKEDDEFYWTVSTLSEEAKQHIIEPLLNDSFQDFFLKHGNETVVIKEKRLKECTYQELLQQFYNGEAVRNLNIRFRSFTAFRQSGRYQIIPDMRLIFQSLMMKYSSVSGNDDMIDEDALEQLFSNTVITRYKLQSGQFPMEGKKIPGFYGFIRIHINGTDTMARYARMLLRFGEYSGIGIKTGMGMGAIMVEEVPNVRQRT